MSKDLDPPATPAVTVDSPDHGAAAGQRRRLRVATLLNTTELPATTALPTPTEPKLPPYVGD